MTEADILIAQANSDPNQFPEFLDSIIENIPDMIFVKDAKDLRFVRFNHAGEKLLGYTKEQLIGKTDYDFFSKEEADFFTAKDRKVLANGRMVEIPQEPIHTRTKGVRILHTKKIPILDRSGKPQYLLGISRDITQKIKSEMDLMKSEDKWRSLVHNSPDLICTTDLNHKVTFANRVIPPRKIEDVLNKSIYEFFSEKDHDAIKRTFDYVRRTSNSATIETTAADDTPETCFNLRIGPIHGAQGMTGWIINATNITDKRKLERKVLDISRQEQQKIGQFIHDGLVQDLAGISLMAKALEKKVKPKSHIEENQIHAISTLVSQCIAKARDLARGLHPVDLTPSGLMSALEALANTTEKLFGIKCQFNSQMPVLFADNNLATNMYLIAKEAIHNAVKHGSPKRIDIDLHKENGKTILSIKDDGLGFINNPKDKNGMGLSIMRYRSKLINATLKITENEQGGITVKCLL